MKRISYWLGIAVVGFVLTFGAVQAPWAAQHPAPLQVADPSNGTGGAG